MMEIIAVVTALLVLLAAKKRRKFRRYIRGNVDENLALGTLGPAALAVVDFDETVNERTFVSSADISWSLSNYTPSEGDGPIVVGLAHGDYTSAEILEFIQNTGSWNEGLLVEQEIGRRKIKIVGQFDIPGAASLGAVLNDGKPIKTRLKWILNQGETLQYWGYNQGTSALATTDPDVRISGAVHLWPTG